MNYFAVVVSLAKIVNRRIFSWFWLLLLSRLWRFHRKNKDGTILFTIDGLLILFIYFFRVACYASTICVALLSINVMIVIYLQHCQYICLVGWLVVV